MPIAVCPHPPRLLPDVAQGASVDLAELRTTCESVVARLLAAAGESITLIGTDIARRQWDANAGGTLAGFGIDVRAGGDDLVLPLSLTVGAWLLDRAGWHGARRYIGVTGEETLRLDGAVLVLGDGTAMRSVSAPGHFDGRAIDYDGAIAAALADGDTATLAELDLELGRRLWAGGAPALRTLGRSLAGVDVIESRLRYDDAPFGVGYFVAEWEVAQ